jgi:hypothetical protein
MSAAVAASAVHYRFSVRNSRNARSAFSSHTAAATSPVRMEMLVFYAGIA